MHSCLKTPQSGFSAGFLWIGPRVRVRVNFGRVFGLKMGGHSEFLQINPGIWCVDSSEHLHSTYSGSKKKSWNQNFACYRMRIKNALQKIREIKTHYTSPAFTSPDTISSIKTQFIAFIFELFTVLWNEISSDKEGI